ncbi:MAG: hypothetical protein K5682_08680, partial [Lachnospiraceae bacterium]|nr:hypothetical protein [Lachnospiraceae bacterium]
RLVDTSIKPDDLLKLEEQWAAEDAAALAEENKPEESTDLPDDGGSNASSQSGSSSSGSSDSGIASDASENHTDLATALKVPSGVSVDFAGYDTYKSFVGGENNAFSLVANEGKQLLVVQLNFYNNNASDVELDFLDAFPNIIARTNNSHANSAQLTVLTNDLITYKGTIAAGSNQILALVFEISDSITSIDSMDFVVTIDGDVSVVTIF